MDDLKLSTAPGDIGTIHLQVTAFAAVRASDTTENEILNVLAAEGITPTRAVLRKALLRLQETKSIAEVEPGVWHRWHSPEAQRVLYPKEDGDDG